jgi:hypothetical protein
VNTVPTERAQVGNGDGATEDVLRWFPVLASQCPASILRLAQFDREQWEKDPTDHQWRSEGQIDKDGLDAHARKLLECVQVELALRRGTPLEMDVALELWKSRKVAIEALIRLGGVTRAGGNKYAKAVQAEVSPGAPLAICTGGNYVRYVQTVLGVSHFVAQGCRSVFEDAPPKGRMWPTKCPNCRPRNGKRNPGRDQTAALQRRAAALAASRFQDAEAA